MQDNFPFERLLLIIMKTIFKHYAIRNIIVKYYIIILYFVLLQFNFSLIMNT